MIVRMQIKVMSGRPRYVAWGVFHDGQWWRRRPGMTFVSLRDHETVLNEYLTHRAHEIVAGYAAKVPIKAKFCCTCRHLNLLHAWCKLKEDDTKPEKVCGLWEAED